MNDIDTPAEAAAPSPHPLARELAAFLATQDAPRVLLLGYGSGRNLPVLLGAGAHVTILEAGAERASSAAAVFGGDPRVNLERGAGPFAAALSTHALLHGTPESIATAVASVLDHLCRGAPFFLTLGTKSDPRFGTGRALGRDTYAADSGSEAGIPHTYFDEGGVRSLLRDFTIGTLEETSAAESAGAWAHTEHERATLRHWFVRARRDVSQP